MRLRFRTRMLTVFGISVLLLFSFTAMNMAIFSGKYETGGKSDGWDEGYSIAGVTKSYSSMAPGQAKANAFALYAKNSYGRQDAEAGWYWKGTDSRAPLHYACGYINGRPTQTNIDWFPAGANAAYSIVHRGTSGGKHKWEVNAMGRIRYVYATISKGDMALIGEEINCANSAEFWDLKMLGAETWIPFKPVDWPSWDSDPGYRFLGGRPYGSNSGQIVPGKG